MNDPVKNKYFPLYRSFPERVKVWKKRLSYGESRPAGRGCMLVRTNYLFPAPSPETVGKEILFISDLHYQGNEKTIEDIENLIGFSRPDYLILGGDQVSDTDHLEDLRAILPRLKRLAPVVLAVGGNWEESKKWLPVAFWEKFYAGSGIVYLANEAWQDEFFRFTGVRDVSCGMPAIPDPRRHDDRCNILIAHSPDTVVALDEKGQLDEFDGALCGHTHGGQIRLPFFGAIRIPSRYGTFFDCGIYRRHENHLRMIVSTGASECTCKWRFNCRREFVIIKFRESNHYHIKMQHVIRG